jgi:histidine ammonia-lyase
MDGNRTHYDGRLMAMKPHVGPQEAAAWIRGDLGNECADVSRNSARLQDRYSLRCAPHVLGVLVDALAWTRRPVEDELNSVNDNPVVDPGSGRILHGGHFYGGHIAFAMDTLKIAVANVADLLDRQLALMVDARYSNGLPANLSGARPPRDRINHGLKALQISVSAWTAEAFKLTMPASVFSRSTECHNQDKVSMGTIAARDCVRVLELTEQVVAAMLVAVRQGVALRRRNGGASAGADFEAMLAELSREVAFIEEDRRLDRELHALVARVRVGDFVA